MKTPSIAIPTKHAPGHYHTEYFTDGCDEVLQIVADVDEAVLAELRFWSIDLDQLRGRQATFCLLASAPELLELAREIVVSRDDGKSIPDDLHDTAVRLINRLSTLEGGDE